MINAFKYIFWCWLLVINMKDSSLVIANGLCQRTECICNQEISANYVTCYFGQSDYFQSISNNTYIENNYNFSEVDTFTIILNKTNQYFKFDENIFSDLSINFLMMSDNSLNKVESSLFGNINSVKHLYLSNNNLTDMVEFYNFNPKLTKSLEMLVLKNNSITKISSHSLNYLTNLNYLDLSHNVIDDIDVHNDLNLNLKHLISLDLSFNKIKSIDFRYISADLKNNLNRLNLNSNKIVYLINLNELKNLHELILSFNRLRDIYFNPYAKLTSLTYLDLSNNFLVELNKHFMFNLRNLTKLDASHNSIINLDNHLFKNMIKLEKLYLHHNKIQKIDFYLFKNCQNLISLDLSSNQIISIKMVNEHKLCLPKLKILRLSNNYLTRIFFQIHKVFPQLKMLYLDNNHIKHLDHQINIASLVKLDLSNQNGNLKVLSNNLFKISVNNGHLFKLNLSLNKDIVLSNKTFCIDDEKSNENEVNDESNKLHLDLYISNMTLVKTSKCIFKQLWNKFKRTRLFIINDNNKEHIIEKFTINEPICKCDFRLFLANYNILVRDVCPLYVTYCQNEEFKDDCNEKNEFKC